jgi:hypothetical protein
MPNSKKNAGSEPKLLSGGNPQIPKGEGDEPVQANIAAGIGSAVNDTTREVGTALGIAVFGSVVKRRVPIEARSLRPRAAGGIPSGRRGFDRRCPHGYAPNARG